MKSIKLINFVLVLTPVIIVYQGCGSGFHSTENAGFSSELTEEQIEMWQEGKTLWANNCMSCHGNGADTVKRNRSFIQIRDAITSIPQMQAISLTDTDIQSIAFYLANEKPKDPVLKMCGIDDLPTRKIRRLSSEQFKNSIEYSLNFRITHSMLPEFGDSSDIIGLTNNPSGMLIGGGNIEEIFRSVENIIAKAIVEVPNVKDCANSANAKCLNDIITTIGPRTWRRPLTSTEIGDLLEGSQEVLSETSDGSLAVEFALSGLFLSHNFLYRSELGDLSEATADLDQYELASLLSYMLWDFPPDEELMDAAKRNELGSPKGLKAQVTRMINDPKFANAVAEFYMDYLRLNRLATVEKDIDFGSRGRAHLLRSAKLQMVDQLSDPSQSLHAPFSGEEMLVSTFNADFFNRNPANFDNSFTTVTFPANERSGILTHPTFLMSMSGIRSSGIVQRGVFTLEQLLCFHFPPPPDDMSQEDLPPGVDPAKTTTRELLHMQHSGQKACVGCHQTIDPAGAGYENFDAFGNFRLVEKGDVPIDSSGSFSSGLSQPLTFNNSIDYVEKLVNTDEFKSCSVKHFFKYTLGASEVNSCIAENTILENKDSDFTLQDLIQSIVESSAFRQRRTE